MVNVQNLHEIDSVSDLLKVIDGSLYSGRSRWIYRGHSKSCYKLLPSIGRLLGTRFSSPSELYIYENNIYNEFFIRTYSTFRERNRLLNLTIAQHHGLQTRLLDWTFSPLIGLFFAVVNESSYDYDGALYGYQPEQGYNQYPNGFEYHPLDNEKYESDYYFAYTPRWRRVFI